MAQFHSLTSREIASMGPGISGDLYYANDTGQLYICVTNGTLFPASGILSGGIDLSSVGPQGPQGAPGVPIYETPHAIDLLKGKRK